MSNRLCCRGTGIIIPAIAAALIAAGCSGSSDSNRDQESPSEPADVYRATITSIEIENADTGEALAVGGDEVSGKVVIKVD